jgi:hypothetical protein
MVDALHAAHRRVKRGGIVIDARPDASRHPRIVARGRVRAFLTQSADADQRDARSDAAVARTVAEGLFRHVTGGRVWHDTRMGDLAALDAYAEENARYAGYERGTRGALIPFRRGPLTMRRAIKFEVLERL